MSLPERLLKPIALLYHDFTYFVAVARSFSRKLDKEDLHNILNYCSSEEGVLPGEVSQKREYSQEKFL